MESEFVERRELGIMLDPIISGQERIEKKVDSLVEHRDSFSEKLQDLNIRLSIMESKKVNWPMLVVIIAAVLSWILAHLKWG